MNDSNNLPTMEIDADFEGLSLSDIFHFGTKLYRSQIFHTFSIARRFLYDNLNFNKYYSFVVRR